MHTKARVFIAEFKYNVHAINSNSKAQFTICCVANVPHLSCHVTSHQIEFSSVSTTCQTLQKVLLITVRHNIYFQSVRVTINPIYSDHDERVRQKRVVETLAAHDLHAVSFHGLIIIHFPNKYNGWYTVTLRGNA